MISFKGTSLFLLDHLAMGRMCHETCLQLLIMGIR